MKRTVFIKVSKNLVGYRSENNFVKAIKIITLDSQTKLLKCQNFLHYCSSCLNIHHNYFDGQIKLFSDPYLAKYLNTLSKSFFSFEFHDIINSVIDKCNENVDDLFGLKIIISLARDNIHRVN